MLVRRLPTLALLVGLPLLLAHCSSDPATPGGGGGGSPAAAGTSPSSAGQAPVVGGGGAGGSASPAGGGGGTSVAGTTATGGSSTSSGGSTSTGGSTTSGGSASGGTSGGSSGGSAGKGGSGTGGGSTGGAFKLTSTEIVGGMTIPEAYTCDSKMGYNMWGTAPSFKWENPPTGTMSYAFFVIDWTLAIEKMPADVNGNHSAAWNIPTTITSVPKGWMAADLAPAKSINGAYLGPCPPNGPDTYHMIVMALPMASYNITATGTAGVKSAYDMLKGVALATAEVTGTYKKK